ncbi:MAG: hypothetical protein IT338_08970 [Thermomicrobiales bacterium]|nr:hypothetical protein [Thermomicrobiales bacterium]
MATGARRRATVALMTALTIGVAGATAASAESLGSTVTVGGGTAGVGGGDTVLVAPGVTISGGTVSNGTGIGIDAGGGSSIGTTSGGSDSAAVAQ